MPGPAFGTADAGGFVIARDGTIPYAEVSPDYTRRSDPEELLPALQELWPAA